jgi:hypothetical protein
VRDWAKVRAVSPRPWRKIMVWVWGGGGNGDDREIHIEI